MATWPCSSSEAMIFHTVVDPLGAASNSSQTTWYMRSASPEVMLASFLSLLQMPSNANIECAEVDHRIHGPLHGLFIRNHLDVLDGDRSSAFHLGELGGPLEQFQDETRITTRATAWATNRISSSSHEALESASSAR